MKKFIFILVLGLIAMFSNAQSPNQVTTLAGVTSFAGSLSIKK